MKNNKENIFKTIYKDYQVSYEHTHICGTKNCQVDKIQTRH